MTLSKPLVILQIHSWETLYTQKYEKFVSLDRDKLFINQMRGLESIYILWFFFLESANLFLTRLCKTHKSSRSKSTYNIQTPRCRKEQTAMNPKNTPQPHGTARDNKQIPPTTPKPQYKTDSDAVIYYLSNHYNAAYHSLTTLMTDTKKHHRYRNRQSWGFHS